MKADKRPWIAYVGPVAFPEGGAAARRILGNAQALRDAGYDVVIVSGQKAVGETDRLSIQPGISCVSVNERDGEHLPRFLRYARYARMGRRSRQWLHAQQIPPEAIIVYSGYSPYLLHLTNWARRQHIPILFDAVEWYTASSWPKFLASPYLWNIELAMRVLIPRLDGVVAISRCLEEYYTSRGLPVVRVPPLLDVQALSERTRSRKNGPLRLAYAGSPGAGKDLLDIVVGTVVRQAQAGNGIVLDIVGVNEDHIRTLPALAGLGARALPGCLRLHGQVPHWRAVEVVADADYTVFLRPENRVSRCGFPTKFVESMAVGTPVVTNLTSDLGEHLADGKNGFICRNATSDALHETLRRILTLSPAEHLKLRHGALIEARRSFGYRLYSETLHNFVLQVKRQKSKTKRQ